MGDHRVSKTLLEQQALIAAYRELDAKRVAVIEAQRRVIDDLRASKVELELRLMLRAKPRAND